VIELLLGVGTIILGLCGLLIGVAVIFIFSEFIGLIFSLAFWGFIAYHIGVAILGVL
jgi:hypothetical protein